MSKAFVRASSSPTVGSFSNMLPAVEMDIDPKSSKARLGKTAEGLLKLQEEARNRGFEEGRDQGNEIGRQEGYQAIRQEMAEEVNGFRSALIEAAGRVDNALSAWYRTSEQSLSELSVLIAARILGREISLPQDSITALVRDAIAEITTADKVRIRVHPFDSPLLKKEKALVLSANATVREVEIVDDPNIVGGARIESDSGAIDATIGTQLELALKAIQGRE